MKTISGMKPRKMFSGFLKYLQRHSGSNTNKADLITTMENPSACARLQWLKRLRDTPNSMWMTPRITDIFILKELRKVSLLLAMFQICRGHMMIFYRVNSEWIRPVEHTRNRRVQLQNFIGIECLKPRANWMESRSETGHHTSAIRHFCVTSMLHRLSVW
ncbi:hypothetical protein EYF80_040209 [Liparis tanakae]|uniref:Uncharacterized protein n=1 Tax=Liparis tanakae TaxID=230148 RepID=A0A4Z2G8K6_9TELE|nr:hypothetical protein EYF80_040209 [Liparis tanakae]